MIGSRVTPFACIQKRPGESLCGRVVYPNEHMFLDADRALDVYANGSHLKVCENCAEWVRVEREDIARRGFGRIT